MYYIIKLTGFNYTVIMMSLGSSVRKSFHQTKHKHFKLMPKESILASFSCQPGLPHAQCLHKPLGSYTVTWSRESLMVNFNFRGRVNAASLSLDPFHSFDALQTDRHTFALLQGKGQEAQNNPARVSSHLRDRR